VDAGLTALSEMQDANGNFSSWDTCNAEGTAQVIMALCALGIDPATDPRFVKNGNSAIDGLMVFYNSQDGGFYHLKSEEGEGSSNNIATDQSRDALIVYYRYLNGYNGLYDLSPEKDRSQNDLNEIIAAIDSLPANPGLSDLDTYASVASK
ncbi:MAG: hypothetical protein Q4C00_06080, partial [Bacillota bacterium]|nr:hypothetical protein [Bacillota bacterium]